MADRRSVGYFGDGEHWSYKLACEVLQVREFIFQE